MTKLIKGLLVLSVLALAACAGQPVYNVTDAPVVTVSGKALSMKEVQQAITRAGIQLGWQIAPEKPGQLTGRLALRTHQAVVDIKHDTKTYSIAYRDSVDLGAKDGMIHKNYNSWVQNLDKAIRAQLSQL